jgi:hypothetical protein
MTEKAPQKVALNVLVPAPLKADLQKLADADRRNLSQYVVLKLEQIVSDEKAKTKRK